MVYRALTTLLEPLARLAGLFMRPGAHFEERLGFYGTAPTASEGRFRLWIHGASAGEVNALVPLIDALRKDHPNLHLTLTTTSLTGRKLALEKDLADQVTLAPLDLPGPMRRAFDSNRPQFLLIAETEFWPLWMDEAKRRGVKVALVNGRVSDKSYPSYRRFRPFFRGPLSSFSLCLVQTETDRDRLVSLGAPGDKVRVMGQMKYDLGAPEESQVKAFRAELGLTYDQRVFTFGSLRDVEDCEILAALPRLLNSVPEGKVILAPRHFRTLALYGRTLDQMGVPWSLRSRRSPVPWRVLVLDTMGELGFAFALSRAAFVGGTLVPIGGHNVMEPALSGVPVCFGPHTANVREAVAVLLPSGGAAQVVSATEAMDWMARYVDADLSQAEGAKARDAVESLRGATHRTAESLRPFFGT